MEVVVNIPQKAYEQIVGFPQQTAGVDIFIIHKILQEGKVLPKGHGDLKDIAKIEEAFWNNNLIDKNMDSIDNGESQKIRRAMIRTMYLDVPTMVEADKENRHGDSN